MIKRREFLKLAGTIATATPLVLYSSLRKFPDDWTVDQMNEYLFFRGLRPCPHSYHSSDEEFAECVRRTP